MGVNVEAQWLSTEGDIAYLVIDVSKNISREIKDSLDSLEANIKTRLLF